MTLHTILKKPTSFADYVFSKQFEKSFSDYFCLFSDFRSRETRSFFEVFTLRYCPLD